MLSVDTTDFECVDVNECLVPEVCHTNSYCTNFPGSYSCVCNSGFVGDGLRCLPLCKYIMQFKNYLVIHLYQFIAPRCRLQDNRYVGQECPISNSCSQESCFCPPLYIDVGEYCVPNNELSTIGTDNTPEPSSKSQLKISYLKLYLLLIIFAVSCAEINTCHAHAQCIFIASQQKHRCQCTSGYEGDGYECSLIGNYYYEFPLN